MIQTQLPEHVTQEHVTTFYDQLVFPSKSSHAAYSALVPDELGSKKVGDFGCGQSLFLERFRQLEYDAVFLDISPKVIDQIDYGTKICASLTEIPLPDDSMDHIFCIGVVHHIPEMEKAIHEILRVLKPGGQLTLGVYASGSIQAILRKSYDATDQRLLKTGIRTLSGVLIRFKNRNNKLDTTDHNKRIRDLLDTPLVRYEPVEVYRKIISAAGAVISSVSRISQMNILQVTKG